MKIKYTLFLYVLFSTISIHAEVPNFELLKERVTKNEESSDDLYNLAMMYRYDQKSKDLGLAKYYMTIAADKDHPDALYELGMMFVLGGKVYKTDENGVSNTTVYWDKDIERSALKPSRGKPAPTPTSASTGRGSGLAPRWFQRRTL